MGYKHIWEKVLNPDEKVEYEFSVGKKFRIFAMFGLSIILIPLLFFGASAIMVFFVGVVTVFAYYGFYVESTNAFAFTNKRVVMYQGLVSTDVVSINYEKITDIKVEEPFPEFLIAKTGNIAINTAGSPKPEIVLRHIDNPYEAKKKLDLLKDRA